MRCDAVRCDAMPCFDGFVRAICLAPFGIVFGPRRALDSASGSCIRQASSGQNIELCFLVSESARNCTQARTHARTPSEWRVCAVALRHICISALVKVARADPTRDAGVLRARKASNMQAVSSRTSWRCPCLAALAWRPQLVRRTTRRSGSDRAPLPCSRLSKFDTRGFKASRRPRGSEETSLRARSARFKGRASLSAIGPSLDAGRGTVWVYAVQAARRERRHATPPSRGTGRVPGNLTSSLRPMAAVRRINSVELCRGFGRSEAVFRSCEAWTFGCLTCAGSGRLSVIGGMFVL